MNLIERFEQSFERLLEGSIASVFRSPVQPAEVGRKLERAMSANQVVSVEAILVPNEYRVDMHPADMVLFVDYIEALCRQMETWLAEVAAERGFTMIARPWVHIAGDADVPRRAIRVTSAISDRQTSDVDRHHAIQRTEVYRVVREATGTAPLRLRLTNGVGEGEEVLLHKQTTSIGRATDNDIVLASGEVSRHHARLDLTDGSCRLTDLGSTNGTRVNGNPIHVHNVRPGDELTFGTVTARLLTFDPGSR